MKAVLDTNVLLGGLQSKNGASLSLLKMLYEDRFQIAVSVPLILEYEAILKKKLDREIYGDETIERLVDSLCAIGDKVKIFYLWRPYLKDPFDDHILELAIASGADCIVTFNIKDLAKAERFGIRVVKPDEFIGILKEEP